MYVCAYYAHNVIVCACVCTCVSLCLAACQGDLLIEEADEAELLHSSDDDEMDVASDEDGSYDQESEKEEAEDVVQIFRACPPPPAPSPAPFDDVGEGAIVKGAGESNGKDGSGTQVRIGTQDAQEEGDGGAGVTGKQIGMATVMFEEISKFLTAWTCNFPASLQGKRRRPRTSHGPSSQRLKRARSKLPAIAAPDANLDDYDELSRKALNERVAHEAALRAAQQAAQEKRRQAREERKQHKQAQRQAQLERQRTARLARAVKMNASRMQRRLNEEDRRTSKAADSSTYMDERDPSDYWDSANEDGGDQLEAPGSAGARGATGFGDIDFEEGGSHRRKTVTDGMAFAAAVTDARGSKESAMLARHDFKGGSRKQRLTTSPKTSKKGGLHKWPYNLSSTGGRGKLGGGGGVGVGGGKHGGGGKWGKGKGTDSSVYEGESWGAVGSGGGVDESERAVQSARADRGQHKKYVGCRVMVKMQGQWRFAAVTSHLISHPKRYSVMLDNGSRLDLNLPNEHVRMMLTRSPLTTVDEEERELARIANLRPDAQASGAVIGPEAVGCRARVLYDMGSWHCGWVISCALLLEGSSSTEALRYKFRLLMDDNDYEDVLLPSPDGDVEIIPGFRTKYLEGKYKAALGGGRGGGSTSSGRAQSDSVLSHKLSGAAGGRGGGGSSGGFGREGAAGGGEEGRGGGGGGDGGGGADSHTKSRTVERGGGSAWNRFLIQKKGLGLNQTQLKSLYKAQMQSRGILKAKALDKKADKARDARKAGYAAREARRERLMPSRFHASGKCKGKGRTAGGAAHVSVQKRDGRKDSSWNWFLIQHKGRGLTKEGLKAMYHKSLHTEHRGSTTPARAAVAMAFCMELSDLLCTMELHYVPNTLRHNGDAAYAIYCSICPKCCRIGPINCLICTMILPP